MRLWLMVAIFLSVCSVVAQDHVSEESTSAGLSLDTSYLSSTADIGPLNTPVTVAFLVQRNERIRKELTALSGDPSKRGEGLRETDTGWVVHLEKHPDLFRIEDVFSAFVGNLTGGMKAVLLYDLRQMGLPAADGKVLDRWSELADVPFMTAKKTALANIRATQAGSGLVGSKIGAAVTQEDAEKLVGLFYDAWAHARIELTVRMLNELSLQGQRVVLKFLFESDHYQNARAVFEVRVNDHAVDAARVYGF